ncbi:MAG: hypothetical protein [Microviridae sp.]|nr:MAG: hypothetical protein [Microviridae sp.]
MTSAILLFLLIKEIHHETPQNVQVTISPVFHQGGVLLPQEKLPRLPDARRHSPLIENAVLQAPTGLSGGLNQPENGKAPSCLHD